VVRWSSFCAKNSVGADVRLAHRRQGPTVGFKWLYYGARSLVGAGKSGVKGVNEK
jgi:hypothetical protein